MNARERLQLMIRTDRGSMTVWSPSEVRDAFAAYDAERHADLLRSMAVAATPTRKEAHDA